MSTRVETFEVHAPTITVRQISGRVTIEPSPDHRTEVTLTGADATIAAAQVELTREGIVVAVAKSKGRIIRKQAVDMHLRVPSDASLRISTVSGDVTVSAPSIDTRINSVSADLVLTGACIDVQLTTVSGDIEFNAPFVEMVAKSISGDMQITAHRGGALTVSSVSGDIDVNLTSGLTIDIEAKSLSGDLRSQIALDQETPASRSEESLRVVGKTISGDLHVRRASTV